MPERVEVLKGFPLCIEVSGNLMIYARWEARTTLMRMQSAYEIVQTRKRRKLIWVRRVGFAG